jgi:hypothetical protein
MASASEFEYEDELELELLDFENGPEMESDGELLTSPNLIEFRSRPDNTFHARVSGFGRKMDTPPSEADDPGRPVLKLHQNAVTRIVNEIKARTASGLCVDLYVLGYVDSGSEWGIADLDQKRANAISNQIWARLPAANKARVNKISKEGRGIAVPWFSDTHKHRALNRHVEVGIFPANCGA